MKAVPGAGVCAGGGAGFTLIELLIVVALIAILSAIAVPNFLEAQVRAKVGRASADLRVLGVALEAYRLDQQRYPLCQYAYLPGGPMPADGEPALPLGVLSTPVAYLAALPLEVFPEARPRQARFPIRQFHYRYTSPYWAGFVARNYPLLIRQRQPAGQWAVVSAGPDRSDSGGEWILFGPEVMAQAAIQLDRSFPSAEPGKQVASGLYDPSNGTASAGDLARIGP